MFHFSMAIHAARVTIAVIGVLNAEVPEDNKLICAEGSMLHALQRTPSTSCSITRSSKVKATLNSVLQAKNAVFQSITLLWRQTVHIHSLPVTQQEAQLVLHWTVGDAGQHDALQVTGVVIAIQQVPTTQKLSWRVKHPGYMQNRQLTTVLSCTGS